MMGLFCERAILYRQRGVCGFPADIAAWPGRTGPGFGESAAAPRLLGLLHNVRGDCTPVAAAATGEGHR